MKIDTLLVTQNGFRNYNKVVEMANAIRNGSRFNSKELIKIYQTEDGKRWIFDGHHRVGSLSLAGETSLYSTDYEFGVYNYEMLNSINWLKGYVTPFDPRTHVRLPNFFDFKKEILSSQEPRNLLENRVRAEYNRYAVARGNLWTVQDLLSLYK